MSQTTRKSKTNEERIAYLNAKTQELVEREEEELVLDFDQALEEKEQKPIKVKFQGKIYEVPSQMPFNFAMFFFRNCYKKVGGKVRIEIPEGMMVKFIELMFGEEFTKAVEGANVSVNFVLETMAMRVLDGWGYRMKEREGKVHEKNVQIPGS